MTTTLPAYFLSHGGGPWPWLMARDGSPFDALDASLKDLRRELGDRPRAVLLVSAHWEEAVFSFSGAARPPMLYDYYNFPPEMYAIRYDAPGEPALAARAAALLEAGGMAARIDPARGFDHGTFSLMQAIWPEADMPVVQMSIRTDYDPAAHIAAGHLIASLRDDGVAIIGSGLSYHNLRNMGPQAAGPSRAFDHWLQTSLLGKPAAMRETDLVHWTAAPAARLAHPREDHLLPLMVAAGAAREDPATLAYHEDAFLGSMAVSSFRFG
ncbi:MAG TPA: class III extradiol ring-cleavage dioxygenase [Paracoccaceae bacterium]|nr:class III extradiol ring-cleavage dioxygenase [Paracoccaceae bacterium]